MTPTVCGNTHLSNAVRNKMVARGIYDRLSREYSYDYRDLLHRDFLYTSPNYLPWGGVTTAADHYFDTVVPALTNVLDLGRFSCSSITSEDSCVVALFSVGIVESTSTVTICELWFLGDGTIRSIWSSLFEPLPLLVAIEQIKRPIQLQTSTSSVLQRRG